jgi:hypothetical protein
MITLVGTFVVLALWLAFIFALDPDNVRRPISKGCRNRSAS